MALNDLLGHRELLASLNRELGHRRSQGYLFSGPRGVGKELVAEGLVLSLLCEREGGMNFCCTPDQCPNRGDAAEAPARQTAARAMSMLQRLRAGGDARPSGLRLYRAAAQALYVLISRSAS